MTATSIATQVESQQSNERLLRPHLPEPEGTKLVNVLSKLEPDEKFLTKPAFPHPGYVFQDMYDIKFEHRAPSSLTDFIAYEFMGFLRSSFDFFTGYKEPRDKEHQISIANSAHRLTPDKWLARFIVLESVAGIPGAVAGFLRHLHALRRFKRDKAWVETLLDEAYNEKMHLLTFLKIAKPTIFTQILLYFGQYLFCICFFLVYLFYPKICHRFVGYLEEEAVSTYSRCLSDMELGLCPDLSKIEVPQIAKNYWNMAYDSTFYDLIQYIRADEAKHREVNHTLANLKSHGVDRNPFVLHIDDANKAQPSRTLENHRGCGWDRDDLIL